MLDSKQLFKRRIGALLIDYLVILAWMTFIGIISFVAFLIMGRYPDYLNILGPIGSQILFFTILTLPVGIYLYITEVGQLHATLGKQKFKLNVTSINGGSPNRKQILIRNIIKLLPWEIAHTFIWQMQYVFYLEGYDASIPIWIFIGLNTSILMLAIYIGMIFFRKDGRGPHDLLAKTHVSRN